MNDPSSKCDLSRPGDYTLKMGKKKYLRIVVE